MAVLIRSHWFCMSHVRGVLFRTLRGIGFHVNVHFLSLTCYTSVRVPGTIVNVTPTDGGCSHLLWSGRKNTTHQLERSNQKCSEEFQSVGHNVDVSRKKFGRVFPTRSPSLSRFVGMTAFKKWTTMCSWRQSRDCN